MKLIKWIPIFLVLLLVGCSKLTLDNYNKIAAGMTYTEVTGLIGKPDKCDDLMGIRSCQWSYGKTEVHVSFAGDKVVLYSSQNLQ